MHVQVIIMIGKLIPDTSNISDCCSTQQKQRRMSSQISNTKSWIINPRLSGQNRKPAATFTNSSCRSNYTLIINVPFQLTIVHSHFLLKLFCCICNLLLIVKKSIVKATSSYQLFFSWFFRGKKRQKVRHKENKRVRN